tara:strand:+ start:233 stop:388 length:156 start_codon:yes stop_codon:yes gene_type:complete
MLPEEATRPSIPSEKLKKFIIPIEQVIRKIKKNKFSRLPLDNVKNLKRFEL